VKTSELRELDKAALENRIVELKKRLFDENFSVDSIKTDETKKVKKEIARIKTIMVEKEGKPLKRALERVKNQDASKTRKSQKAAALKAAQKACQPDGRQQGELADRQPTAGVTDEAQTAQAVNSAEEL
jgi:ribosomal protein L29